MLNYPLFFRQNGVRLQQQLLKPPMILLNKLFLPVSSIYHYVDHDVDDLGPMPDDYILQNAKEAVVVDHVTRYGVLANRGKPVDLPLQTETMIATYHRNYRNYRRLSSNQALLKNPRTLLVVSYNLVERHYRYIDNWMQPIHRTENMYLTVIEQLKRYSKESDRQQYLMMNVPSALPPVSWLDNSSGQLLSKRFNTESLRLILNLWKWLGEDRQESIFAELTEEELNRINLILVHGGMWTILNLGILNSWRMRDKKDTRGAGFAKIPPAQLQRRFLRLLMAISETTTLSAEPDPEDDTIPENDTAADRSTETQAYDQEDDPRQGSRQVTDYQGALQPTERSLPNATKVNKGSLVDMIKSGAADALSKDDKDVAPEDLPEVDDSAIDRDLEQLELVNKDEATGETFYKPYTPPAETVESGVTSVADELARKGLLSAAEHRRMVKLANRYREIKNPYGGKGTLQELAIVKPEDLAVAETNLVAEKIPGVIEPSMLSSSSNVIERQYIKKVLPKDIAATVVSLQRAGIAVVDYTIQPVEDYNDSFEIHSVKVVPVIGKPTTLRFQIPKIGEDGNFKAGGVKNRMRRQRGDMPIRKTAPDTVALTSYYSKMFVVRSERAVFNYPNWLTENLVARGIDTEDRTVTNIRISNVFNHEYDLPRAYSTIATKIAGFTSGKYQFSFDYDNRTLIHSEGALKILDKQGNSKSLVPCGTTDNGILVMDRDNNVHFLDTVNPGKSLVLLGTIEEIVGLPLDKRPIEVAEVGIFGKDIPLGFVLAYHVGLGNLLATLKTEPRRVKTGSTYNLTINEFIVKFEDEALIFDRRDQLAMLIFGGFNRYRNDIKNYSVYAFDKRDVYANILDEAGIGARHIREFELMFKMWTDPITRDLLIEMKEPTDLFNLFLSAARKLTTDYHPRQMSGLHMRDKGYERISGMIYFEMVKALRGYVAKPASPNASVDLNPMAVWMGLLQDQTVMPIEESNPIHALKEKEVVIYSGAGGRTGRSMTEESRRFDPDAIGRDSEATVDSGDVGTILYTTPDANYTSLRGTCRKLTDYHSHPAKMVSTSMLVAPGSDRDDPKRVNFSSVQNSQTTHAVGYTPMPTRTGYERVIAHRTDAIHAKTADQDGVVENVTDKVVTVRYKDDTVVSYEIGRRFGVWAGHVIPHTIETKLVQGAKIKKGNVICYNSNYFTPDKLDPSQVILRSGILARTVLLESTDTLEDSSAISESLASKLITHDTQVRNIRVTFDQEVRNLIRTGEAVTEESILCTIHNATSGNTDIFDDDALTTLEKIQQSVPKAKMVGTIEKIEVIYTGELEDMSSSLRSLAERSDNDLRKLNKQLGKRAVEGRVEVGYRVDGHPMDVDTAVIRVYITGDAPMGIGDKSVFSNQLKSVTARVMTGVNQTADGVPLDAIFGYQSLANRIVLSAELLGTTNTLLVEVSKRVVKAYKGS